MNKLIVIVLSLFMWSGNALSHCLTSITASTPTEDFVDNGNETVMHTKTGLVWKQCSEGRSGALCETGTTTVYTWQAALQRAETLNNSGGFATYTDWRVPSLKELASIVEIQCESPTINETIFPSAGVVADWYWSASPYAGSAARAWEVHFSFGYDYHELKNRSRYVRLVRGGF